MGENKKAVILAAGKGTRMKSDLPKVVHRIAGKCLVDYVIEAARDAGATDICLVVGYKHEVVEQEISHKDVSFTFQPEQLGTGHAVMTAENVLPEEGLILVLCGDTPLITGETLKEFTEFHKKENNSISVLTAVLENPYGYGRIVKDSQGGLLKIVEEKDVE